MRKVAFLVSRILGPVPLLCLLWFTTAVKSGIGFWKALWVYPLILLITLVIPIALTTYLITVRKVADIEWKNLEARRRFLLPLGVYSLSCLLTLTYFLTNRTIFHLTLLFSAIVLATLLIYAFTKFKISAHIVTATSTFAAINLFFNQKLLWLFLLLIPIIWARYTLKVHTLKELIAGFVLSSSILFLALLIFGWPAVP